MHASPDPEFTAETGEAGSFDNVVDLPTSADESVQREIARTNLSNAATARLEGVKPNSEEEKAIIAHYQQEKRDLYKTEDEQQQAA